VTVQRTGDGSWVVLDAPRRSLVAARTMDVFAENNRSGDAD
jgi:hypothetical protein